MPHSIEPIGQFQSRLGNEPVTALAYVAWFDDPNAPLGSQLPAILDCPCCGHALGFDRLRGLLRHPSVASCSVSCSSCAAIIHLDKTPKPDRGRLTWMSTYRR